MSGCISLITITNHHHSSLITHHLFGGCVTTDATNSAPDAKLGIPWMRILDAAGPFLGLGLVLAVFGILQPDRFATPENARNVVTQAAGVAVCALGATVVVIAGGIDLSVGSIISVTCVASALLL